MFICISLFAQPENNSPQFAPKIPFESQVISLPAIDGQYTVYYTYKIPYRLLVFERKEDSFVASFRVLVEILDQNSKLIARDIKDSKIFVADFEATGESNLFLQDYLKFEVKPEDYNVSAVISDMNSTGELRLKPIELKLSNIDDNKVIQPVVIRSQSLNCDEMDVYILANSGGDIPFSNDKFNLVIPVRDTLVQSLDIDLENNGEKILTTTITKSIVNALGIHNCAENIVVTSSAENILSRNFILSNINEMLNEGEAVLSIRNKEREIDEKISMKVVWLNKPMSLLNPEKAIEYLSYIESENIVANLLDEDESDYPKVLNEFWTKYDPTPETTFNEIMFEYYSRVDYAIKEFKSLNNNNGAKTDRGMVYIKFGNPDNIERISSNQGQIIEVWTYSSSQKEFSFIDKNGTGNFILTDKI